MQSTKVNVRELPWKAGALLVLHSDGIRHPFEFPQLEILRACDPTLIAAVLHRDLARGSDDATVLVLKDMREVRP